MVRRGFANPIVKGTIDSSELPSLPVLCRSHISWRESVESRDLELEGVDACGVLSVSIPCCVLEVAPADVIALAA